MKLYRTEWYDPAKSDQQPLKLTYSWHGTQRDAAAHIKRMREQMDPIDFAHAGPETKLMDVPTEKAALIQWLNEHNNCELPHD
jgi:hypothetical protein